MKIAPFSRKISISQTARPAIRVSEPMIREARRPRNRPVPTQAMTPDAPRTSAVR